MTDEKFWIEREDGSRLEGPIDTKDDAFKVRYWLEKVTTPETFWIRSDSESRENRYGRRDTRERNRASA